MAKLLNVLEVVLLFQRILQLKILQVRIFFIINFIDLTLTYLTEWQRKLTTGKPIELLDLKLEGTCIEGDPLKLFPICKLVNLEMPIISDTMASYEFQYESDVESVELILENVSF